METIQQGMSREARIAASLAAAQRNHPLAGLGFAGLGMPAVNMINPWCPLHFERVPGGQVQDSKYDSEVNNPLMAPMDPYMMMGRHLSIAGFFASPVEYKAFQLAAEALTASPDKRIPMAEEALRLSPHCAEAYNVLAMYKAKDFEEALEYYKKGAELGPRAFEQERWEEQVEQQDLHDVLPYR
jgi:tetratricopeptide (TPR) repeat protein